MTSRAAAVAEARTWLGTPYHHCARLKGIGADCAQMPLAVYHACGLIPELRPKYDPQWHLHREAELYLDHARAHAREIDVTEARTGDMLVWRFGRTFSHGGILVAAGSVVHAWIDVGVIESDWRQHSQLNNRPVKAFTLWND